MINAQIIAVTTAVMGPSGPLKKIFAIGLETPEVAMEELRKRMKPTETARWLDTRGLNLSPGEIRQI